MWITHSHLCFLKIIHRKSKQRINTINTPLRKTKPKTDAAAKLTTPPSHISTQHTESSLTESNQVKHHKCEECSSRFRTRAELTRHSTKHTSQRPFSCSDCSATFKRQSHLWLHSKKHRGLFNSQFCKRKADAHAVCTQLMSELSTGNIA